MYYTTDNRLFHHPPARSAPGCLGFGSSLGWLGSVPWNPMALEIDLAHLGTFKESDRCYMRASARAFLCIASWESLGHGSYPDTSGTPTLASLEYDFRIFHDIVKHIPILLEYIKYKHTFFPIKLNIQYPWHSEGFAQRSTTFPAANLRPSDALGFSEDTPCENSLGSSFSWNREKLWVRQMTIEFPMFKQIKQVKFWVNYASTK